MSSNLLFGKSFSEIIALLKYNLIILKKPGNCGKEIKCSLRFFLKEGLEFWVFGRRLSSLKKKVTKKFTHWCGNFSVFDIVKS